LFYTIYQITNIKNQKIYIGKHQTKNLDDGYLGSGKILKRSIAKHGEQNFKKEILHVFDNEEEMNLKEKELVTEEFCSRHDTYNLCPGGHGGFGFINKNGLNKNSDKFDIPKYREQGRRFYKKWIEKYPPGHPVHEKKKAAALQSNLGNTYWLGKEHSEITKLKMGLSKKITSAGSRNSQYGSFWITNGILNKKCRDVTPEGWRKGRI
jgi:hypothetical protein